MDIQGKGMSVGKEGLIHVDELKISVIVRDVRVRWLIVDYLVEPTAGTGKMWVESEKVQMI